MPTPYDFVPEEVKKELAEQGQKPKTSGGKKPPKQHPPKADPPAPGGKKGRDDATERVPDQLWISNWYAASSSAGR